MNKFKFTREELYNYIWENSLSSLIATYNIAYPELKQLLVKFNIPAPPNGYWSKLKAGQQIPKTPLPVNSNGEDVIEYTPKEKKLRVEKSIKPIIDSNPKEIDSLIVEARKIYEKEFNKQQGDELIYIGWRTLNIRVSQRMIKRAFDFLNLLFKTIRKNNGSIKVEDHHTWVLIDQEKFEIHVREKQNRILKEKDKSLSWVQYDYKPSGILIFKIEGSYRVSKEWKDGSTLLEEHVSSIIEHLKICAQEEKQWRHQLEQNRIEREKQNQIKLNFEKLRSKELEDFIQLNVDFERWQKAQNMRFYLKELKKATSEKGELTDNFKSWLQWAYDKIDWYDPLINKEDELMKDIDKNTLSVKKSYW